MPIDAVAVGVLTRHERPRDAREARRDALPSAVAAAVKIVVALPLLLLPVAFTPAFLLHARERAP